MNSIIILLVSIIIVLILTTIYFYYKYKVGLKKDIELITEDLNRIFEEKTDEKLMVFTSNEELINLLDQLNKILESYQKLKVDYRRSEIARSKMISNISHDIKTPITVILGYIEIMRLKNPEDEVLKKLENKGQEVVDLINNFFTFSKLESEDMDLEMSKVNINEICRNNVLDFYNLLNEKGFTVDISIPEKNIYVLGNIEGINRILNNLISNVIKYGDDGKFLGLKIRKENKEIFVDIIDKGKGIEKEYEKLIFERLYTLEESRNKDNQGNGLGLAISKKLAEKLNGNLTFKSIPNEETIFTLKLKEFSL